MKILLGLIKRPKLVNMLMIFVLLVGAFQMINTKNQGYPSVDFGVMTITTVLPGGSPEEVELKVTNKIEDQLLTVSGVGDIQSYSIENISVISVKLDDDYDYQKTKNDIYKAVDRVENLPAEIDSRPLVTEVINDAIPVQEIAIYGSADYNVLRRYAVALEKQLQEHPLVGVIDRVGYLKKEIKVQADYRELSSRYVTLEDVVHALQAHNVRKSGGNISIASEASKLVLNSEFTDVDSVKNVVIRSAFEGGMITIGDVALVKDDYEPIEIAPLYNGKPMIQLLVMKKKESDILKTSEGIDQVVKEFKKNIPDSVQVSSIVDYSVDVRNLMKLVLDNAFIGLVLVVCVLLFLLNFKVALWTAVGIPISILFGFIFFPVLGLTINFITLMAIIIILGMVVDDAIILGENIYRYREMGFSPMESAERGIREVIGPVFTTVITTIVAFLPMLFMGGVFGKFMYMMPIAIALILIGSLFECLFLLPSHITHSSLPNVQTHRRPYFVWLETSYERLIRFALFFKYRTILCFFMLLVIAFYLCVKHIPFLLFPSDDGLLGTISYELPNGTTLEQNREWVRRLEQKIDSLPDHEIQSYVTTLGQKRPRIAEFGYNDTLDKVGNILINFSGFRERTRTSTEIIADLKLMMADVTGSIDLIVEVTKEGPPVGKAVTVTLIDNNNERRLKYASELKDMLNSLDGVSGVNDSDGIGKNEYHIIPDSHLLAQLGITTEQIGRVIRTAYEGNIVSSIDLEGEEVQFRVSLLEEDKDDLAVINHLSVKNRFGKLVPIGQAVRFEKKSTQQAYTHFNGDRSVTIFAEVDSDKILPSRVNQLIRDQYEQIADEIPGFRVRFGGEEKDTQESMQGLAISMLVALIAIYMILVVLFDSFVQPFLVMLAIPFSFSGVVFAYFFHDLPLSFPAMIGLIGLIGVVVNDSLVMISFLNNKGGKTTFNIELLADAAKMRLRPILLTTLTTAAGLFPTAYGFGGDNPFIIPMILAIAWGLVFATVITLILMPCIYLAQREWVFFMKRLLRLS